MKDIHELIPEGPWDDDSENYLKREAAPELYEALKECDAFFAEFYEVSERSFGKWGERWKQVKDAIAKAEGKDTTR